MKKHRLPQYRSILGVTLILCCLAAALVSAMAFGEQGSVALGPSSGRYIGELSLGFGQEGVISLDLAEYSVLGQPLCEESEAYLGYKRSDAGITDLVLSGTSGTVAVDGREYEQVQGDDVFAGLKGSGYLFASRDAASGSPIVSLTVESASEFQDEPIFALHNDGTSPIRDDGGRVVDFGVSVPTYVFMLRENVCRPYIGEARVVTGADLRDAVLAAANAGFDNYCDMSLTAVDGSYAVIGYNRCDNDADAITCITARPESEESYAVGNVQFELMGDVAISSEVPYRLFCTKDDNAGNPILDFENSEVHDVGTMGAWAERTFVKFGSALSAQEAKSESEYMELAKDTQELACVPVIMGDADVVYEATGALLQGVPPDVLAGDDRTAEGTADAVANAVHESQSGEHDRQYVDGQSSGLDAVGQEDLYLLWQGIEDLTPMGEDVPAPQEEAETEAEAEALPQNGELNLEAQGIEDLTATGEGVPAPQEGTEDGPEAEALPQDVERTAALGAVAQQVSESLREGMGSATEKPPVEKQAATDNARDGDVFQEAGEEETRADEDAAAEDEDGNDIAYRGIEMTLGYVCAKRDLPVSIFAQSEHAEARRIEPDKGSEKPEREKEPANTANPETPRQVDAGKDEEARKVEDANGTGAQATGTNDTGVNDTGAQATGTNASADVVGSPGPEGGETLPGTVDGSTQGMEPIDVSPEDTVQADAGMDWATPEGATPEGAQDETGYAVPEDTTQEGTDMGWATPEGMNPEGVQDETGYMVENPSESYQEFIDAYESDALTDDFNEDTYLQDEATPIDGGEDANTNTASVFGEGAAEGVAVACGMAAVGAAIGYGSFLIKARRASSDGSRSDTRGGGEDE